MLFQVECSVKRQCLTEHQDQTVVAPILNIVPQQSVTTQSSSTSMTSQQVKDKFYTCIVQEVCRY